MKFGEQFGERDISEVWRADISEVWRAGTLVKFGEQFGERGH